ncbi:Hypothetical protein CAP_1895 [Chondromyces apiculatus DSM 436]|uniref:Uncharacterized protein n=1 Tax=Chondromyces apiculatus DSM 436 TaxID=1192034 RepID=A0A017TC26_9BACT|nr:Hypothetical protein CAP_1895 [Chondromyces apiculatus DSM 436]
MGVRRMRLARTVRQRTGGPAWELMGRAARGAALARETR